MKHPHASRKQPLSAVTNAPDTVLCWISHLNTALKKHNLQKQRAIQERESCSHVFQAI